MKKDLWAQYKAVLMTAQDDSEAVSLEDLFNFFDSAVLEEFLEYLKTEHEVEEF